MPCKLSTLKEIVSKKSMENINEDPAYNSVIGNVKKLYDALQGETDYVSTQVKEKLGNILDAHAGKEEASVGDNSIELLHGPLELYYMTRISEKQPERIQEEKKRQDMKNLIEYVAGGLKLTENLGFESKIKVSEEQQLHLDHMESVGRTERRTELQEEESQSRWNAVRGKSGLNILDEHNAAVNALPKSIKGEDATLNSIPLPYVMLYLASIHAFSGAVGIMRAGSKARGHGVLEAPAAARGR